MAPLFSPDREVLRKIYDEVVLVDVLDSGDTAHLSLMKRPELGITFTKLHCWNLTQYSKCVFMDADTLVSAANNPYLSAERTGPAVHPAVGRRSRVAYILHVHVQLV